MRAPATCNFKPLQKLNWVFSFLFLMLGGVWASAKTPLFRISLSEIPKSLDPHFLRSSSGQYVSQQLFRNFYRLNSKNEIVPELGESCKKTKSKWVCTIHKEAKWSDGTPITASDFVESFKRILSKPSPRSDLLWNIKNAKSGLKDLGLKVLNQKSFEIQWEKNESGDEFILMSPLFVPLPGGKFKENVFSGPFQVDQISAFKVEMSRNPHYFRKPMDPLKVHWLLMDESLTVQAFEKKELDFLRRVPTALIQQMRARPEYFDSPVLRMDALFFGPALRDQKDFRQAVVKGLDYSEMQILFNSKSKPGCAGVPLEFYTGPEICYETQKLEPLKNKPKNLSYLYSSLGGEDHRRLAEWLQNQFQTLFQLKLQVRGLENKIFLDKIRTDPPAFFRRGLSPENPSCYGILESFKSGHPDNLSLISNPAFDQILLRLKNSKDSKSLCREALQILLDEKMMIPTGRIFFSYMIQTHFNGLELNLLNHMDLSGLKRVPQNVSK